MRRSIVNYVPKKNETTEPWHYFGADQGTYEQWEPHICGICCLKMVGDTLSKTLNLSLYELTMQCLEQGGFRITDDGDIVGVFHYPLAELGNRLGIPIKVAPGLTLSQSQQVISDSGFAILSVDLAKLNTGLRGGHLLLLHKYLPDSDEFVLHDCASAIGFPGNNIHITSNELAAISNSKGLIVEGT